MVKSISFYVAVAAIVAVLGLATSCAAPDRDAISDRTAVTSTSDAFIRAVRGTSEICPFIDQIGCSCTFNGVSTPCDFVLACLESGLCEEVEQ